MELFFIIFAITAAELPAIILRYLPFAHLVTTAQKKKLLICYGLCFIVQHVILYFLLKTNYVTITPLTYKEIIFFGSLFYVLVNFILIKGFFFQHLFVFSMQGGYSLFLHSIVAIILAQYGKELPIFVQFTIQSSGYIVLFTAITIPLWKYIKRSLVFKGSINQDYYWNIIWLVPTLVVYSDAIVTITINQHWIHTVPQIASRLLTGLAIFITWKCVNLNFKSLDKILNLKNTNRLLSIQEKAIQNQAKILRENDRKISILKHDMRHHLQLLSSLIEHKNFSEATLLISQLNASLQNTKPIVFCKNTVINSALLVYITKSQKNGIEIISEIDIPEIIPWNSNDIAILFANTLENAINASMNQEKNKKEIHIVTRYADEKLAINIKNRFDGKVLFGETGFPTTKKFNHGIGIQSIISIVEKYHAHVSCTHKDGWFSISFLFSESFIEKKDLLY